METQSVSTDVLHVTYHEYGDTQGWPCIMGHGFPYDPLCYRVTAEILAEKGARVNVPYLRGYGPTRYLSDDTLRSGEQAALGADMLALMDALELETAVLGGYDWGGRAACIVAALWPERVSGLVSGASYNIQNIAISMTPGSAAEEASYWYQYYFHSERGERGLTQNRRGITRLLWEMWSPPWAFTDQEFEESAASFDNPDFVRTVIHSYRHRFGLVPGDPAYAEIEARLAAQPPIPVPTISIDGADDGVSGLTESHASAFTGPHEHRILSRTGHNLPQERPVEWAKAVLDVRNMAKT